jgi:single-strand DNA-binding protein
MYASPKNHSDLIGNLVADPELRSLASGTSVCNFRLAVDGAGNTREAPGVFEVSVYGPSGESAARHLTKGSLVHVHGRLQHRTWRADDDSPRSAIGIIGEVTFLKLKRSADDTPADENDDAVPVAVGAADGDDIPF